MLSTILSHFSFTSHWTGYCATIKLIYCSHTSHPGTRFCPVIIKML